MANAARGTYRGIYSALIDDPDFQKLSPNARLVFYTARLCVQAGPAAIFRFYSEILMSQTGLAAGELETALQELEAARWILREGVVLWIRNGLHHDPTMRLSDRKHRVNVERAIQALPRLAIVGTFCDYYKIARPFEDPSRLGPPSPTPSPNTDSDLFGKGHPLDRRETSASSGPEAGAVGHEVMTQVRSAEQLASPSSIERGFRTNMLSARQGPYSDPDIRTAGSRSARELLDPEMQALRDRVVAGEPLSPELRDLARKPLTRVDPERGRDESSSLQTAGGKP